MKKRKKSLAEEFALDVSKGIALKPHIEEIYWLDAQSSLLSMDLIEIKENLRPLLTKSVGYILFEYEHYLVLGFMIFGTELIKHHQVIPKALIVKRNRLTK